MAHCCWGLCNSDSQYGAGSKRPRPDMIGVRFIPFPKPKTQMDKCLRWIKLCGNAKICKPDDITRNHYVCTKHTASRDWYRTSSILCGLPNYLVNI